ncbi:hypothetical protein GIB67_011605 [Kingdonia uniflora]|uniref:Uncharacterized protein n=1 Tax=Kingdonia uniflora TaxID=39325 RepID=A0A7J7NMG9_9MAGN|nr:hypothetical protein GIB67_011605 [Kingdonia uniflora]
MRTYKLYVKNPTHPEACIVMRYITEEAIMYCMKYMPDSRKGSHKRERDPFMDDDDECYREYPLDIKGTNHFLDPVKYEQARRWVWESYDPLMNGKSTHNLVWIEDKVNGCVIDPKTNLIYVNLEELKRISKEEDDLFVLASQVFYWKDLTRSDYWHVFLDAPKKLTRDVDAYEDPLVFKGTTHDGSLDLALAREVMDEEEESIGGSLDEYDVPTYMKGKVLTGAQRLWCDRNSKYWKFNYDPYPNDERKKNPKVPAFRTDVYLAIHTRVDGSSLIPELDVELEKIRNICIVEPEIISLVIDNDPVVQVCGKDNKGRTRACGLNVSREEVLSSYHLRDQLLQEKTTRLTLEKDLVHVKGKLTIMDEKLSSLGVGR